MNALIGLTALEDGERLPLTRWGAGTRRLAALEIAAAVQSGSPITVVDEIERGVEPHRQRLLMRSLEASDNQVFLTTHSPTVLSAAGEGRLWYLDGLRRIGAISGRAATHVLQDAEAFLAKLIVVAEGKTEAEFLGHLLSLVFDGRTLEHGIWITDGSGNEYSLSLLESLQEARLQVAGFVDSEGLNPGRWNRLADSMGDLLWQWDEGCLEENVIPLVPSDRLEEFLIDPQGELSGQRYRTLQERLRTEDKSWETLMTASDDVRGAIVAAASGTIPDWVDSADRKSFKSHARSWFKREGGGQELAQKCTDLDLWKELRKDLSPFLNALRSSVGLDPLRTIPS